MSKIAAAVLSCMCLILFVIPASAQLIPNGNVYVGAEYSRSDIVINKYDLRGWNGSVEALPFSRFSFLGVVLDASGVYRSGISQYTLVLGPRLSKSYGKWRPFVHAMGGVQRVTTAGASYNPVAFDLGGGVDYKLFFKNFSWRVQADYSRTRYLSANESNVRGSTGIVWRF